MACQPYGVPLITPARSGGWMSRDRNASRPRKHQRGSGSAWKYEVGPGAGAGGRGGNSRLGARSRRAGWILGCTEVRNLVFEISVTQFQRAR